MYTKQEIILRSYREGQSMRAISRELQISRKTVCKYIREYEESLRCPAGSESPPLINTCNLSTAPCYKIGSRVRVKLTSEITAAIDGYLEENVLKRKSGMGKQCLKNLDILHNLHEQGFDIGYTSVCNYIAAQSGKSCVKEAFIRQVYKPASMCEFDWGEVKLEINGVLGRYFLAVFTACYSNYRYALLFNRQDSLSFVESHVLFFSHVQGVYHQMVYDNMRVAVSRFVGLHEKEPTRALLQMRGHYLFSHRFCNIYSGNEKGHVERSVEYVRRRSFGSIHRFSSLKEAQKHLLLKVECLNGERQQLTGKSALELFALERPLLYGHPGRLSYCDSHQLCVDKYSTLSFGTNHYSVPDHLVGLLVDVNVYGGKLDIYHRSNLVATHERCFGRYQWIISIEHYLETFRRKPGAIGSSVALARRPYLECLYREWYTESPREFIDLLQYCMRHEVEQSKLEDAVQQVLALCLQGITTEQITAILGNKPLLATSSIMNEKDNPIRIHSENLLRNLSQLLN